MGKIGGKTAFGILAALSLAHMLNDAMQSVLNAVYPLIKKRWSWTSGKSER